MVGPPGHPVWLLSVRPDYGGRFAADADTGSERRSDRLCYERQYLPLWNVSKNSRGDPPGGTGMKAPVNISRRSFLVSAGGFFVAVSLPRFARAAGVEHPAEGTAAPPLGPFIHIPRSGPITFICPTTEMWQGIYTAEAQLLAEELGVDLNEIRVVAAPPDEPVFKNPGLNYQITGGSWSLRAFYMPLRQAGASARDRLIAAAARRWKVDPKACVAKNGTIVHTASGRSLRYGALADAAALEPAPPPEALQLTSPENFRLIGQSPRRVDTPDKANGRAIF